MTDHFRQDLGTMKQMNSLWLAALLKKGIESELFRPNGGLEMVRASLVPREALRKLPFLTAGCFGSMSKDTNSTNPARFAASIKAPVPPAGSMRVLKLKSGISRLTSAISLSAKS